MSRESVKAVYGFDRAVMTDKKLFVTDFVVGDLDAVPYLRTCRYELHRWLFVF